MSSCMLHPLPLPCPFCGSHTMPPDLDGETGLWAVYCPDCGSKGPTRESKQGGVEAWNHRIVLIPVDDDEAFGETQ